jgi:hypothetical protein
LELHGKPSSGSGRWANPQEGPAEPEAGIRRRYPHPLRAAN